MPFPPLLLLFILSGILLGVLLFKSHRILWYLTLLNLVYIALYPFAPALAANCFFYGSPLIGSFILMGIWKRKTPAEAGLPSFKQMSVSYRHSFIQPVRRLFHRGSGGTRRR
jgi:hypothetical protein